MIDCMMTAVSHVPLWPHRCYAELRVWALQQRSKRGGILVMSQVPYWRKWDVQMRVATIRLGGLNHRLCHAETVCLAAELKHDGITIISQNPGWVETDMGSYTSEKMGGKVKPPLDPPTSISKQLQLFAKLTPADTGKFFEVTGDIVPW